MHVTLPILNTKKKVQKLEEKKTAKDWAKVLERERREIFEKGLKELKEKEERLIRTCTSLEKDITKYSCEAETKLYLKLLVNANALIRRKNELKIEVKGLQDDIEKKSKRSLADKQLLQYGLCW